MRDQFDETLDAEQHAARAAARRRTSLRDRLLESEDRSERVVVSTSDGHVYQGVVEAVGIDHVVIRDGRIDRYLAINHIVALEAR
jgi:ribosomal protein L18